MALGFWQLDRADEKRRKQQEIDAHQNAKPISLEEALENQPGIQDFQRIYLHGHYLAKRSIYLVGKFHLGRPGYEVLTPFKLDSRNQIVILSRGWTPLPTDPKSLPELKTPTGELHLIGTVHIPHGRSFFIDEPIREGLWPLRLHNLNMEKINRLFEPAVFPYVLRLDEAMPGVLLRYWPVPKLNPERSTSYAIQWFSMAFLVLLVPLVNSARVRKFFHSRRK